MSTFSIRSKTSFFIILTLIASFLGLFCPVSGTRPGHHHGSKEKKLIIIMADGVRPDYFTNHTNELPTIKKMMDSGVFVDNVHPVFPTITYPNWYSIPTGLYPESHGFVDNNIWDPKENISFKMPPNPVGEMPLWWEGGEPIWVTATKQNVRTGMFIWDGCQVKIHGIIPNYCAEYKWFKPWFSEGHYENDYNQITDTIVSKFKSNYWSLALMYWEATDSMGHKFGPHSNEAFEAVKLLDRTLGRLMLRINELDMKDQINVMLLSDHGMYNIDEREMKVVEISDRIRKEDIIISHGWNARISLFVKKEKIEETFQNLKRLSDETNGFFIYKREEMPEKYHYKSHPRIGDIILIAKRNTWLSNDNTPQDPLPYHGDHGYDIDEVPEMKTMLLATGPGFKKGIRSSKMMSNVDHYNIFCHLLDLNCLPNNGSFDRVRFLLTSSSPVSQDLNIFLPSILTMILVWLHLN